MSLSKFVQRVKSDIHSLSREELISKYRSEFMEIFGDDSDNDKLFELTIDAILDKNKKEIKNEIINDPDCIRLWADIYTYRKNDKIVSISIPHLPESWLVLRTNPKM